MTLFIRKYAMHVYFDELMLFIVTFPRFARGGGGTQL